MRLQELIEYYEKYLIGDIDAMLEKADQPCPEGKTSYTMAVPITFATFACLDIFGFLISYKGEEEKLKKELNNTTQNIAYSMLKWNGFGFPVFDVNANVPNKDNNPVLFKFINIYRHGINHTFFPKAFSISNIKEGESYSLLYKMDNRLVFNVRKFYSCFKSFWYNLKMELSDDVSFSIEVEKNINMVFKEATDFEDFSDMISAIHEFNRSYSCDNTDTNDCKTTIYTGQSI